MRTMLSAMLLSLIICATAFAEKTAVSYSFNPEEELSYDFIASGNGNIKYQSKSSGDVPGNGYSDGISRETGIEFSEDFIAFITAEELSDDGSVADIYVDRFNIEWKDKDKKQEKVKKQLGPEEYKIYEQDYASSFENTSCEPPEDDSFIIVSADNSRSCEPATAKTIYSHLLKMYKGTNTSAFRYLRSEHFLKLLFPPARGKSVDEGDAWIAEASLPSPFLAMSAENVPFADYRFERYEDYNGVECAIISMNIEKDIAAKFEDEEDDEDQLGRTGDSSFVRYSIESRATGVKTFNIRADAIYYYDINAGRVIAVDFKTEQNLSVSREEEGTINLPDYASKIPNLKKKYNIQYDTTITYNFSMEGSFELLTE